MNKSQKPRPVRRFWNWIQNDDGSRTLYLDGPIAEESWLGDEVTPKQFKSELLSGEGDITIWINSPGGDIFAANQIYNKMCIRDRDMNRIPAELGGDLYLVNGNMTKLADAGAFAGKTNAEMEGSKDEQITKTKTGSPLLELDTKR